MARYARHLAAEPQGAAHLMPQAIIIQTSSGAQEFEPTGVTDEWELTFYGPGGPTHGGYWTVTEVTAAVADAMFSVHS